MARPTNPTCRNTNCPHIDSGVCTIGQLEAGCGYQVFADTVAKDAANIFLDSSMSLKFAEPLPKILGTVTNQVKDTEVLVGSILKIDTIFSHELKYGEGKFEIEVSDKEVAVETMGNVVVDRHTLRSIYNVAKEGAVTFNTKYTDKEGTESTGTVEVTAVSEVTPPEPEQKPEVKAISASKNSIAVGEDTVITISFTKAVANAADIIVTTDDKLTAKVPVALGSDNMSATATYTAAKEGAAKITAKIKEGTETKETTVTVTAATGD